jgi:ribosomal protein L15E
MLCRWKEEESKIGSEGEMILRLKYHAQPLWCREVDPASVSDSRSLLWISNEGFVLFRVRLGRRV